MTDLINRKATSIVLTILCLLFFAITVECEAGLEARAHTNTTGQTLMFPKSPVALDDRSLDGALKTFSPLVLDCWELGCRPCELIEPKIAQMANDFQGRIVFGKLCIDSNPVTMSKYGVSRTPTLLIFKNGTLVHKHIGNHPKEVLEHIILTALHMR